MKINELRIENLRNLAQVLLEPHPRLNFISGNNGAGKTSILESLVVLSRGRSFRTSQAAELIGPAQRTFRVFAETERDDQKISKLGLERAGKKWRARKNGQDLTQISQLTRSLPLVLMEPNSHLLVSGTPENRRKFIDWGVFHVEHSFLDVWGRFSRVLKQRNAALRNRQSDLLDSLDATMLPLGEQLNALRARHAREIQEGLSEMMPLIGPDLAGFALEYQGGWGELDYEAALFKSRERDLERGVTHLGPHRADVMLMIGTSPARAVLSRGEQKTLSAALLLTQAKRLAQQGERPVILLDDLASEFDETHFSRVLSQALGQGAQVWVTGTRVPVLPEGHFVFHVKHGALKEVV